MVRRRPFRHALAAILCGLLVPSLAFGQLAFAPFILTTGVDDPGSFVTLAESTTFGPSGSIFDYSTRIAAPKYIGPPPDHDDAIYTTTEDLTAESCASTTGSGLTLESTIQDTIENALTAGANNTVFLLPPSCKVQWYVNASSGTGAEYTVPSTVDDVQLYCADPTTCGIDIVYRTGVNNADNGLGPDYEGEVSKKAFAIGTSRPSGTGVSCSFDGSAFVYGEKLITTNGGCSIASSGASAWGPGDIIRLTTNDITGQGTGMSGASYTTRVSCIRDSSGNRFPPVEDPVVPAYEAACAGMPASGSNLVLLIDPPPFDYRGDAYYWGRPTASGGGLGEDFTDEGGATDQYEATSGHTITQIERVGSSRCGIVGAGVCGNGTETNNVVENFWFNGLGWDNEMMVGSGITDWPNAFGGGHYRDIFDGSGRSSLISFGKQTPAWESSSVSLHSTKFLGIGGNSKASGRILQINKTDPITIHVAASGNADLWDCCTDDGNPAEGRMVVFSKDVAEPIFAGQKFLFTREPDGFVAGSPGYWVITLTGVNDSTFEVDNTAGGWLTWHDDFAGGTLYLNQNSSNIQIVNNSFRAPLQHAIYQGSAGAVYAYNYVRSPLDEGVRGRGPFFHGNTGQSGNIFEGNDQDQGMITHDSANTSSDNWGEGTNNHFFKNRKVSRGSTNWPTGTATGNDYGHASVVGPQRNYNQYGFSNEFWSIFLNSSEGSVLNLPANQPIDDCDNNNTGDGSSACVDPGQLWNLAVHRNKCASCDFDTALDPLNTTTDTDTDSDENGEADSGLETAWSSEVGSEPTSIFFTEQPEFWTGDANLCDFGHIGAYYDDFTGTLCKIPAQYLYEATTP